MRNDSAEPDLSEKPNKKVSFSDGLLTYRMPQGDRRGSAYEFYDWTYDGEWKGDVLSNGLGCLTDGDFGPEDYKLSYYAQGRRHQ